MTYNPSEDLQDYLRESAIISYRLSDGTYLIAEEVDCDEANNILYIVNALEFIQPDESGKSYLKPWLNTEEEEMIQLCGDKIIARVETPLHIKVHYHKYQ